MRYIEPVFRPPSERNSYILQITYGCSHNKCTFCGMYKSKKFTLRPEEEIFEDIYNASEAFPETRRVFLADGDAFVLGTEKLAEILISLNKHFPRLQRVGIYVNPLGILKKSEEELKYLRELKLRVAYLGLESGSEKVLKTVNKGSAAKEMIDCVIKSQNAGIKMSVIILLGLGGYKYGKEHAKDTAEVLNRMNPAYLSALTLMLVPETPLFESERKGDFKLLKEADILKELKMIIKGLNLRKTIFRSNHASNYLYLEGRFPKDKELLISQIDYALKNDGKESLLIPDFIRDL